MSRRVQLVLLCEDRQQEAFARRFLSATGWETRALRVEKAPAGGGAGEQFVRERFPRELKAHRSRPVSQALVVLIDGDADGVEARLRPRRPAWSIERDFVRYYRAEAPREKARYTIVPG